MPSSQIQPPAPSAGSGSGRYRPDRRVRAGASGGYQSAYLTDWLRWTGIDDIAEVGSTPP
ncbi:MAG: hypothetical protein LBI49_12255 [Nocardiopsaceae bacterium]|nr:hypothetical protein [Nocardiopsaceae bacterium]